MTREGCLRFGCAASFREERYRWALVCPSEFDERRASNCVNWPLRVVQGKRHTSTRKGRCKDHAIDGTETLLEVHETGVAEA